MAAAADARRRARRSGDRARRATRSRGRTATGNAAARRGLRAAQRIAPSFTRSLVLFQLDGAPDGNADGRPWLRERVAERPADPLPRLLLAAEHARLGDHCDAHIARTGAWLLLPDDTDEIWLIDPSSERMLDDETTTEVTPEADTRDRAARELLVIADEAVMRAMVTAAVRRGAVRWLVDLVDELGQTLPVEHHVSIADCLHEQGEIQRPLAMMEALGDRFPAAPSIAARRRRELAILEHGIDLTVPDLRRYQHTSADAIYLLHNSLPHQSGGYATRTHGLLTNLNRGGRQVVGVTRPGFPAEYGVFSQRAGIAPHDEIDNVRYERLIGPVHRLPRTDLQGFVDDYAAKLAPVLQRHRPAVIHAASNWWNGHAAAAVGEAIGRPSVYEVRGLWEVTRSSREPGWADTEVYALDSRYEAEAARAATRVITITGGLRDELVRRGVDGDTITLVPNAVDVDRFASVERDDGFAASLGLDGACVIGFAGTLTFYEGLDDLLAAVAELRSMTSTPIAVLIVGDGPVRSDLEQLAAGLGLADICRFVGRVPHAEVERYLGVIDITPFPRKPLPVCEMVSPLKPLESMASGIPVVVSAVQALAEMVPSDDAGVVVPRADVTALAKALAELVDDPGRRAAIAANAFEWVRAERSWSVISDRVARLYDELTDA